VGTRAERATKRNDYLGDRQEPSAAPKSPQLQTRVFVLSCDPGGDYYDFLEFGFGKVGMVLARDAPLCRKPRQRKALQSKTLGGLLTDGAECMLPVNREAEMEGPDK